ncbi:MAG: hypothetical protein AB2551_21340 [Candidatus Thiodiazotropha sp.]
MLKDIAQFSGLLWLDATGQLMNLFEAAEMPRFSVEKFPNSTLLRAFFA